MEKDIDPRTLTQDQLQGRLYDALPVERLPPEIRLYDALFGGQLVELSHKLVLTPTGR